MAERISKTQSCRTIRTEVVRPELCNLRQRIEKIAAAVDKSACPQNFRAEKKCDRFLKRMSVTSRFQALAEVNQDKLSVSRKLFIRPLSIQQCFDPVLSSESSNAVLGIGSKTSDRFFLVPQPGSELFAQPVATGKNEVGPASSGVGNGLDIRTLVETRLLKTGAERVLPVLAPRVLSPQFGIGKTNDG